MLKQLERYFRYVDDIAVPKYSLFECLMIEIYPCEFTAIRNGNVKGNVNYVGVNLIIGEDDEIYFNDYEQNQRNFF